MKKILKVLIVGGFLLAGTAFAQMGMMNSSEQNNANPLPSQKSSTAISAALNDIYTSQKVNGQSQLNCSKIVDIQFEKLGDAVMGYGITEEQHTAMENMMGGENGAMSKSAHINLGRSYLGCWANYNSGPMPMMTLMSPLSNAPTTDQFRAGGYYGACYWFGRVTTILVWVLLILGIVFLGKLLRKNT